MLNWASNATGTYDSNHERDFSDYLIDLENAKRAAQEPPGTPLPHATNAERKASVEAVMNGYIAGWYASMYQEWSEQQAAANADVRAVRVALREASNAQINDIKTILGL